MGGVYYLVVKVGVFGFVKVMVCEFGFDNICVNCVIFGLIVIDINIGKIVFEKEKEIFVGIFFNWFGCF